MTERTVDLERWRRLSLVEQLANIGAEVGRTLNARRANREERFWSALQRALDLFEATVLADDGSRSYRLKEVGRAKEEFVQIATAIQFSEGDASRLERYFTQLAVASNWGRQRQGPVT